VAVPNIRIPTLQPLPLPAGPTRGMGSQGIRPPVIPSTGYPTGGIQYPIPPITNPDPGKPKPGENEQEEEAAQEENTRDLPETVQVPFDASTSIEFTVPIIEKPVEIPVPKPEVVITAGTTAAVATVGATAAAVFAKPLFDFVLNQMKTVMKIVTKKLMKKKDFVYPEAQPLQLPDQFQFSGHHLNPVLLRQHREQRKGKPGSKTPPSESTQHTSKP